MIDPDSRGFWFWNLFLTRHNFERTWIQVNQKPSSVAFRLSSGVEISIRLIVYIQLPVYDFTSACRASNSQKQFRELQKLILFVGLEQERYVLNKKD